jgi:hypothetical protein
MPIITTDKLGLNADVANPKPVRHINWLGYPMKEGDSYWGKGDTPVAVKEVAEDAPVVGVARKKRKRVFKSAEARKAISERMRAYWSSRRSAAEETTN